MSVPHRDVVRTGRAQEAAAARWVKHGTHLCPGRFSSKIWAVQ